MYDLTDGNGFRCLHHLDIQKLQDRLTADKQAAQSSGDGPHEKGNE